MYDPHDPFGHYQAFREAVGIAPRANDQLAPLAHAYLHQQPQPQPFMSPELADAVLDQLLSDAEQQ